MSKNLTDRLLEYVHGVRMPMMLLIDLDRVGPPLSLSIYFQFLNNM